MNKQIHELFDSEIIAGSLGARRVRLDFNPSEKEEVHRIKMAGALLINQIADFAGDIRMHHRAIERVEEAVMWGVKSATMEPLAGPRRPT